MKKILFILSLVLIQITSFAQTSVLQWQKCLGGSDEDIAYNCQPTPDGGYIVAGYTISTNGQVTGNHGGSDAWIIKLSNNGAIEWQKALGGTGYESAYSIQLTLDGGYIVAGTTSSNNGDTIGNHGGNDFWVIKLTSLGNILWQKVLGGTNEDGAYSIQPTLDGGYILAGSTLSTNGDITGNHGGMDAWIVKLDALGALVWQKALGGTGNEQAVSILTTPDGGYIVAGSATSTQGDVSGNHGGTDAWVLKLSANGSVVWQKALGGSGNDVAKEIQKTPEGGYVVALFSGSNDGDITGNHQGVGYYDAWVVKLSNIGAIEWQKALGGTGDDYAYSISNTLDGGYILSGSTTSNDGDVTGNHGGNNGTSDGWIVKLSNNGNLIWQKTFGGAYDDFNYDIQTVNNSGYVVVGYTWSINGDVIGNHGVQDAWIIKLGPDLSTDTFQLQNLMIFPNPTKNIIQYQTADNVSLEKITIIDTTGKIVLTQTMNTSQINVESLESGIYFLKATSEKNNYNCKFIKE